MLINHKRSVDLEMKIGIVIMLMRYMDDPYVHTIYIGVETGTKADGTPAIQKVQMTFIGEPNLYRCIFQSRKKI